MNYLPIIQAIQEINPESTQRWHRDPARQREGLFEYEVQSWLDGERKEKMNERFGISVDTFFIIANMFSTLKLPCIVEKATCIYLYHLVSGCTIYTLEDIFCIPAASCKICFNVIVNYVSANLVAEYIKLPNDDEQHVWMAHTSLYIVQMYVI